MRAIFGWGWRAHVVFVYMSPTQSRQARRHTPIPFSTQLKPDRKLRRDWKEHVATPAKSSHVSGKWEPWVFGVQSWCLAKNEEAAVSWSRVPPCGVVLKSMQFDKTELNIIIKPVLFNQPNPNTSLLQTYVASRCKIRRQGWQPSFCYPCPPGTLKPTSEQL